MNWENREQKIVLMWGSLGGSVDISLHLEGHGGEGTNNQLSEIT